MGRTLILGANAYLAENIENHFSDQVCIEPRFNYLNSKYYQTFDNVINFCIQPEFSQKLLSTIDLIDVQLANILKGCDTNLVMLSSRKVYGSHKNPDILSESSKLQATDFYSANKIKAEEEIHQILPQNHIILRIGNILGNPVNRIGYKTFIGWISDSIRQKGYLSVEEHPDTRKDFISKDYLQIAIAELINKQVRGTINLGSGFAIPLKELLEYICGKQNIIFENKLSEPRDQFILDTKKLNQYVEPFTYEDLLLTCNKNRIVLFGK